MPTGREKISHWNQPTFLIVILHISLWKCLNKNHKTVKVKKWLVNKKLYIILIQIPAS